LEITDEGFPYEDNRLPFAFIQHIPNSTSIWPDSILSHIRGLNLEIDKIMSQMIETKDHMSNPMWLVATQHQIVGQIKNQPGGQVKYVHVRDIPPPQPIQGIMLPPQVEQLAAALRGQILEISGQSEPTHGRMPQGVRSGVQIAYLNEEDDSKIAPTVEEFEMAIAHMSSMSLSRVSQFYTTERTVRNYKRQGIFEVRKFKGADLKGATDVIPIVGSGMPKSKAARQQYTLELAQLGIMTDPRQLMETLEVGQGTPSEAEKDYAQAERENMVMMYGLKGEVFKDMLPTDEEGKPTAIPVKTWHNHTVHLERHHSLMKDEEFERLQKTAPEVVRLFDEHVAMHQQVIQEQQEQQMKMLMAAKGAPDGPPGAASQPGGNTSRRHMGNMPMEDVIGGGALDLTTQTMRQEG
jgi:hypothetical protein